MSFKTTSLVCVVVVGLFSGVALANNCIDTKGNPKTHIPVRVMNAIAAELDPFVLGDGGLMVFADPISNKRIVVYERGEAAPYTRDMIDLANRGVMVTLKKSCLASVRDRSAIEIMEHIKADILRDRHPTTAYFRLR